MKITPEHYAHMKAAIQAIAADIPEIQAAIAADTRVKDPGQRLRWDCSYRAGLTGFICEHVYKYADDTHVDTALRAIMREVLPTAAAAAAARPGPAELFDNGKFRVLDHGRKGVEVQFRIMGADGPTDGSKWFLDGAGDQIRETIQRAAQGGPARRGAPSGVAPRLERHVGLDDETEILPLAPRM